MLETLKKLSLAVFLTFTIKGILIPFFCLNFAIHFLNYEKYTEITIQETSNDSIIKFVSNQILINGGSYEFTNIDEAKKLFISSTIILLAFCKKRYSLRPIS